MKQNIRVFGGWLLLGLIGLAVYVSCRNVINAYHPDPKPKEFRAYFPNNGELRPADAVTVVTRHQNGQETRLGEISVGLEEFRRLAEGSSQKPLVTHRNQTESGEGQVIDYWLWRGDGFSYHTVDSKSLQAVSWDSMWFGTVWEHKSGDVWLAKPVWEPGWLYTWMTSGIICSLVGFGVPVLILVARLIRKRAQAMESV